MSKRLALLALITLLASPAGCGEAAVPINRGDAGKGMSGGDAPLTPRALAHVTSLHTGEPDGAERQDWGWVREFDRRSVVAVDLRYGSDGEYDGDVVSVVVGTGFKRDFSTCERVDTPVQGCASVEGGLLLWDEEAPEEDPGLVMVSMPKGDTTVLVSYSGPAITTDPRELDLPVSVDALVDLAVDPRVDRTTTPEAVAAGEELVWFDDGP